MKIKFFKAKRKSLINPYFLVIMDSQADSNEGMLIDYAPVGQHGETSIEWLNDGRRVKEVTKEEYMRETEGIYTPEDYLI